MGNLSFVDPNTPPVAGFEPLPIGKYEFTVTLADVEPNKAGTGQNLELEFEHKNYKIKDWLAVQNPSEKAQQIAQGKLSQLCRMMGIPIPNDSSKLLGKKVVLSLGIEDYTNTAGEEKKKNTIKDYCESISASKPVEAPVASQPVPFQDDDIPF